MIAARQTTKPVVRRRTYSRTRRRTYEFYLFVAPWLIGFVALSVFPLLFAGYTSMTNYDGFNLANAKFVGFSNYTRIVQDNDARYAFGRTIVWACLNVPLWIGVTFGVALLLNRQRRGQGVFRTLLYLPSIVPVVAVIWIWRIFLDRNSGLLNGLFSIIRPGTAFPFLTEHALPSLTAVSVWMGLGSGMVIFLAGLQNIPTDLEDAAAIDGANRWQIVRHVTIPLMTPVIFYQLVLAIIGALQTLVLPLLLNPGGGVPPRGIYLYMLHVYQQIFSFQRYGYGMAMLWVLITIVIVLTAVVFRSSRYWVYYENDMRGR